MQIFRMRTCQIFIELINEGTSKKDQLKENETKWLLRSGNKAESLRSLLIQIETLVNGLN